MVDKLSGEREERVLFRRLVDIPSTTYATFGLYRYPAKFIPHVIAYVLENYAEPDMKVFDPFAGYGTVGLVSRIYGHDYELWDLNPILEVLHSVATMELKQVKVDSILNDLMSSEREFIPDWSKLDYWYPKEFLPFLYKVWGFYHSLNDCYTKLLLTIPLLKVTRYFSYDDMQRQKLSKSPKSIARINFLKQKNWKLIFFKMLKEEIKRVLQGLREYWLLSPKQTEAVIKAGVDTLNMDLAEDKDILITSPPYLQSQEYIRQAKMDLFWLGFKETQIKELSKLEIPYRDVNPCDILSKTYHEWKTRIKEQHLQRIFNNYFWGVLGALTRLERKVSSYMFLFVGHTSMRGQSVPIDRIFAEHFTTLGWIHEKTLVDTIVARRMFSYKINPATGIKDQRTPVENLVILRRRK